MNKKGFTVLELIVSFTLASIISIFLLQITIVLKDLVTDATIRSNIINSQAIITERMQEDFLTNDIRVALKCGTNCIRFIFSDYSEKVFKIENQNTFKWGDYTLKLKNDSKFGNVKTEIDKELETSFFDDSIVSINIPVTNSIIEDEIFDIKIVVPYNSEILHVNDDLNFATNNNEHYLKLNGNQTYILDKESIFTDPGAYVYYGEKTCTMINNVDYSKIKDGSLTKKVTNSFEGEGCNNLSLEIDYESLKVLNDKYVEGDYDITYDLKIDGNIVQTVKRHIIVIQKVNKFKYTGNYQIFTVPISGYYKLETWGAGGVNTSGGYGAYASSTIRLLKGEKLYVYVGQSNNSRLGVPNFNTNYPTDITFNGYSGGGATDIRTSVDLDSRILVAAGGGSGSKDGSACGYGLDENGVSSFCESSSEEIINTICGPGGGYNTINSSLFVSCLGTTTGGISFVKDNFTFNNRVVEIVNTSTEYNKKVIAGNKTMKNPYTLKFESRGNKGDGYSIITYIDNILEQ